MALCALPSDLLRRALAHLLSRSRLLLQLTCTSLRDAHGKDEATWHEALVLSGDATQEFEQRIELGAAHANARTHALLRDALCWVKHAADPEEGSSKLLKDMNAVLDEFHPEGRRTWLEQGLALLRRSNAQVVYGDPATLGVARHLRDDGRGYLALTVSRWAANGIIALARERTVRVLEQALLIAMNVGESAEPAWYPVVDLKAVALAARCACNGARPAFIDCAQMAPQGPDAFACAPVAVRAKLARMLFALAGVPIFTAKAADEALRFFFASLLFLVNASSVALVGMGGDPCACAAIKLAHVRVAAKHVMGGLAAEHMEEGEEGEEEEDDDGTDGEDYEPSESDSGSEDDGEAKAEKRFFACEALVSVDWCEPSRPDSDDSDEDEDDEEEDDEDTEDDDNAE